MGNPWQPMETPYPYPCGYGVHGYGYNEIYPCCALMARSAIVNVMDLAFLWWWLHRMFMLSSELKVMSLIYMAGLRFNQMMQKRLAMMSLTGTSMSGLGTWEVWLMIWNLCVFQHILGQVITLFFNISITGVVLLIAGILSVWPWMRTNINTYISSMALMLNLKGCLE